MDWFVAGVFKHQRHSFVRIHDHQHTSISVIISGGAKTVNHHIHLEFLNLLTDFLTVIRVGMIWSQQSSNGFSNYFCIATAFGSPNLTVTPSCFLTQRGH